jgi:hypothetical protein
MKQNPGGHPTRRAADFYTRVGSCAFHLHPVLKESEAWSF